MTHRNRKLLDIAHEAPCFLLLPTVADDLGRFACEGQVVACHSDQLQDGRGEGHKSHDCLAVPGCVACHARFTRAHLGRELYDQIHTKALKRYIVWMWENGKVKVA